jgi:cell division protein FtsL
MSARRRQPLPLGRLLGMGLLVAAVLTSGVVVVYIKYLTRIEFVDLQAVRAARDALDVEWGRLQLEEAALTTHTRVEGAARRDLDMHIPQAGEVRVVEVEGS